MQALYAPELGELLHPDQGCSMCCRLLVEHFESRYSVDNQYLVEFTITVVPVVSSLGRQNTLASLFSTLDDGWQILLYDAQALVACVNEKANTLESASTGLGACWPICRSLSPRIRPYAVISGSSIATL